MLFVCVVSMFREISDVDFILCSLALCVFFCLPLLMPCLFALLWTYVLFFLGSDTVCGLFGFTLCRLLSSVSYFALCIYVYAYDDKESFCVGCSGFLVFFFYLL